MLLKNKIDCFELYCDESLLLKGEQLFEDDKVSEPKELIKNLWEFSVKDAKTHEIEIQLKSDKFSNFTCDCDGFDKKEPCAHVIAAAFSLRKERLNAEIQKKKKRKSPKVSERLTTKGIFDKISKEELLYFLQDYAQSNKSFSVHLKTRFARKILINHEEDKFDKILNSIVGPIKTADGKLPSTEIRLFKSVAKDLFLQFEDAIALKEYTEAFYIVKSLLLKSSYILHNITKQDELLEEYSVRLHRGLSFLLSKELAPELKVKIIAFCKEAVSKSYYQIPSYSQNIFESLFRHDKDLNAKELLLSKKKQSTLTLKSQAYIKSKLLLLEKISTEELLDLFLGENGDMRSQIIDCLFELKEFDFALVLLNNALKQRQDPKWITNLLFIHLEKKDFNSFIDLSLQQYIKSGSLRFLRSIQQQDEIEEKTVTDLFHERYYNAENRKRALSFYSFYKDQQRIFEILEDNGEIDELLLYANELGDEFEGSLLPIYSNAIGNHFKNNIGEKSQGVIVDTFRNLMFRNRSRLYSQLVNYISENFGHRSSTKTLIRKLD